MQKTATNLRIDALDVARGIALIAMATYHFSWDLELFGYLSAGTASTGFLKLYARCIATTFLFMVGFSLVLASLNGLKWPSFLRRLAQVGAAAAIISIATYFAVPDGWIFFGILHHIVAVSLIGLLFVQLHWAVILLAAVAAFVLPQLDLISTHSIWLSPMGVFEKLPNSNDFVPLFPWLAASLTGISAARLMVANGWLEKLAMPKATQFPARQLKFLGRHSLIFYLLHQPLLIGFVALVALVAPPQQNGVAVEFQTECQNVCGQQFSQFQCQIYCKCFETESKNNAAQWSQLPAEDRAKAISEMCTQLMRETPSP